MHPEIDSKAPIEFSQLCEVEKLALMQCSLFDGSFTQEAVEYVLSLEDQDSNYWPLDTIEGLRLKGIIETLEPIPNHYRYVLSPLARAFVTQHGSKKAS